MSHQAAPNFQKKKLVSQVIPAIRVIALTSGYTCNGSNFYFNHANPSLLLVRLTPTSVDWTRNQNKLAKYHMHLEKEMES